MEKEEKWKSEFSGKMDIVEFVGMDSDSVVSVTDKISVSVWDVLFEVEESNE